MSGEWWSAFPRRIQAAALVLPSLLLALLMALDYFVISRLFEPGLSQLVLLGIGIVGVLAFSAAILGRLSELQLKEREQARRLHTLTEAGMSLTAELETAAVLQKIVDLARQVADARYAALGIFDENGEVTQFLTSGITQEQRERIGALPRGRGLLGVLQSDPRPLRVADIARHPASVGFPAAHPRMRSFLGVPIMWRSRSVGNLYMTEKIGAREFSADDQEALLTLAAQAAIAIENARLYGQLERVAALEERHRIGMDLHDGAMQSLYGVGLMLEDAADRAEREPAAARAQLGRAVDRLNATIADLRGYVLGLRPVRAADLPLSESLATLASQVGQQALLDVAVDVQPDAERDLDPARREAVFYIAADALGNVARHARARRVEVRVRREADHVLLEIRDDGVGFDTRRPPDGLGLRNMRERAFATGGTLRVESAAGEGTRIRLQLPVRAEVA